MPQVYRDTFVPFETFCEIPSFCNVLVGFLDIFYTFLTKLTQKFEVVPHSPNWKISSVHSIGSFPGPMGWCVSSLRAQCEVLSASTRSGFFPWFFCFTTLHPLSDAWFHYVFCLEFQQFKPNRKYHQSTKSRKANLTVSLMSSAYNVNSLCRVFLVTQLTTSFPIIYNKKISSVLLFWRSNGIDIIWCHFQKLSPNCHKQ